MGEEGGNRNLERKRDVGCGITMRIDLRSNSRSLGIYVQEGRRERARWSGVHGNDTI